MDTINQHPDTSEIYSSSEEERLVKRIDQYCHEARAQREQLQNRWITALRYWRGEQWKDRKARKVRGKTWTEAVINKVFPIIEQQISMMTDNNPRGVFLPQESSDSQFTKDLEALTHWRARRLNMRTKLIRGCHNSKLFGFQGMYVFWDDSLPGKADVNVRLLDPREVIVDPLLQTNDPEDGEYIGIERYVTLDYLKYRWPEHADRLQADYENASDDHVAIKDTNSLDEELGNTSDHRSIEAVNDQVERPLVKLVSIWYRDYTQQKYEMPTPMEVLLNEGKIVKNEIGQYVYAATGELWSVLTSPKTTVEEPVYPYGRCTIKADKVILDDFAWGTDVRDGVVKPANWPIALGINIVIPHRWFGMDETEQLVGRQDVVNDMVSHIEDHCQRNLHPARKVETGAVVDPKKIKNTPDSVVWMNDGRIRGMEWEKPANMSADAYNLLDLSDRGMETASGMPAQNMGKTSDRKTTATEIATLDRAGRGRVGMGSALLDEYIARIYMLIAQCIQQNYDESRIIRITGDNGQQTSVEMTARHRDVMYDVEIEAGSTMPYDKDTKRQQAVELNNILQGSYLPEVLDAYEVKNRDEILQRNQQWMLFMQYASLLQNPQIQQYLQAFASQMQAQQQTAPQTGAA